MVKWMSKNQGLMAAIVVNVVILLWSFGCQSKVQSFKSDRLVTRDELTLEYNAELRRLENELQTLQEAKQVKDTDLDRQDEFKQKLFDAVAVATTGGTFNKAGLITLLGTITAFGLGVDNRIKDKVIKNRPLTNSTPTTNTEAS